MISTKVTLDITPIKNHWVMFLVLGLATIALSAFSLYYSVSTTMASVLFLAVIMIALGIFQIFTVFQVKGWKAKTMFLLIGILYILCGVIFAYDPIMSASILTIFIAVSLMTVGILRIISGFTASGNISWLLILTGILALMLGGMIIAGWPATGLWTIGMFVSLELLFNGITIMALALSAKNI